MRSRTGRRSDATSFVAAKRSFAYLVISKYLHIELNKEIESISGYYVLEKEEVIRYNTRKVLIVTGYSVIDKSCCGGIAGLRFVNVSGYVSALKNKTAPNGMAISEVESIEDKTAQHEITEIINTLKPHCQVNFI